MNSTQVPAAEVAPCVIAVEVTVTCLLSLMSVLGNGLVLLTLARFRVMQTTANILVGSLAIADTLQTITTAPLFIGNNILEIVAMTNRVVAGAEILLFRIFAGSSITIMVAMMADRFLALKYGIKYTFWKSSFRINALLVANLCVTVVVQVETCKSLFKIDLGEVSFKHYKHVYFKETQTMVFQSVASFFLTVFAVIGFLTRRVIAQKKLRMNKMGLRFHRAVGRQRRDESAVTTVWLVVIIYVVSYLPVVSQLCQWTLVKGKFTPLCEFIMIGTIIPPAANPILYFVRSQRFRQALRRIWNEDHNNRKRNSLIHARILTLNEIC